MSTATEADRVPDLADPATFSDGIPHAALDRIRQQPGLVWQDVAQGTVTGGFWVATRYADVATVLQNPAQFSSNLGPTYPLANPNGDSPLGKHILFLDPPDHSRVRRAAAKSFGPRVVARFEDWIQDVVDEVLDGALAKTEFDWVTEVARLVPSRVVAKVMGVPDDQRDFIVQSADEIFEAQTANDGGAKLGEAFMKVGMFMAQLGEQKLKDPQDDMVTILAKSLDDGEIDMFEYQLYTASLVIAGYETTHTMIGHIARLLSTDVHISEATHEAVSRGQTAAVVDEYLRYITPAMTFARTATEEVEFNGQTIHEKDMVLLVFAAANRDPDIFTDPHVFNPFRDDPRPPVGTGDAGITFSAGPHRCIGHILAKLELRLLLEEMDRRAVTLEPTAPARRGWSTLVNQIASVPVRAMIGRP